MLRPRKGSLFDTIVPSIVLIVFVLVIFMSMKLYVAFSTGFTTAVTATNADPNNVTGPIFAKGQVTLDIFANSIPFIILAMYIGSIVAAWRISSNPAFLPVSILLMLIYGIMSVISVDLIWAFINNSAIVGIANGYPITVNFIKYFVYISTVAGFLIITALYAKGDSSSGV